MPTAIASPQITHADLGRILGWGWYELRGPDGALKQRGEFANLVTQVGDQYYGDRAAQIVGSTVAITAITNATSAVVTTGAAHGYVGTALGAGSAFGTAQGLTLPAASGMRLGTGVTAVAKTGAGAFIGTVGTGTNNSKAFDSTWPQSSLSGSSRRIQYKTTWAAGDATQNSLSEVVITTEQPLSQVAGTAANTTSRALLSPVVNKGASDTLAITWNHDLLGA